MKKINIRSVLRFLFFTTLLAFIHYRRRGVNGAIIGFLIGVVAFLISLIIKKFIRFEDKE